MKIKREIENEIRYIIPNVETYNKILTDKGSLIGGWTTSFNIKRPTLFWGNKCNSGHLSLVIDSNLIENDKIKLVYKESIGKNKRLELSYETTSHNNRIAKIKEEFIEKIIQLGFDFEHNNNNLYIIQNRTKRGFYIENEKIYLSIDEVDYYELNDARKYIGTMRFLEIESNKMSALREAAVLIKNMYELMEEIKDKYVCGLALRNSNQMRKNVNKGGEKYEEIVAEMRFPCIYINGVKTELERGDFHRYMSAEDKEVCCSVYESIIGTYAKHRKKLDNILKDIHADINIETFGLDTIIEDYKSQVYKVLHKYLEAIICQNGGRKPYIYEINEKYEKKYDLNMSLTMFRIAFKNVPQINEFLDLMNQNRIIQTESPNAYT